MRPDELFIHRHLRTRLTLTQSNLAPTIEKHQQQQKRSHDQRNHVVTFFKDESVLVRNQRGGKRWVPGRIVRQKGPVTYLVRVGIRIRFCHVDHLLKTGIHYYYYYYYYYQFLSGTWVAQKAGPANVLPRVQKHIHIQVAMTTYTHTL